MSKYIFSKKDKRGGGVGAQGPPLFWLELNHALIKAKGLLTICCNLVFPI